MEIKGSLIRRGEVFPDGSKISDDCKFNIDNILPVVTWQYNEQKPLGTISSIDLTSGKDKCGLVTVKLNDDGVKLVERIQDNYIFGFAGRVKKRNGNKIEDIEISSISIIGKWK